MSAKPIWRYEYGYRKPEIGFVTRARQEMDTSVCTSRKNTAATEEDSCYRGRLQDCAMSYSCSVSILFVLDDTFKLTFAVDALAKLSGYVHYNPDYNAFRMTHSTSDSAKISQEPVREYGTTCDKTLSTTRIQSQSIHTMTSSDVYHYLRRSAQDVSVLRLMFTSTKATCRSGTLRIVFTKRRAYAPCT